MCVMCVRDVRDVRVCDVFPTSSGLDSLQLPEVQDFTIFLVAKVRLVLRPVCHEPQLGVRGRAH